MNDAAQARGIASASLTQEPFSHEATEENADVRFQLAVCALDRASIEPLGQRIARPQALADTATLLADGC